MAMLHRDNGFKEKSYRLLLHILSYVLKPYGKTSDLIFTVIEFKVLIYG